MAGGEYALAFGGGLVSFLSPCVLPLVPVYLSMVTGLEVAEIQVGARVHLARIARDAGSSSPASLASSSSSAFQPQRWDERPLPIEPSSPGSAG